ncbi:DUF624 domain-containing protein [Enterococcus saccharolyticus]|uniref:Integral membrane protein n=1 Tax=Candidatus Enterococcus willemsii TaxID=1857215 RepID=A0ABQ6YWN3_9ENTE|nr:MULTISPECIES: DUF624 domain-containing protein [Enterococcus]KAF1302119.1 hypothetical protein BAU17_01735 [Enterococcus sp. CU12B]MCD5001902.1 DUF624 domain-containing protein [Enterococcus saccharolyticus]
MKEMKGIIKGSYVLGQRIIDGLILQFLFIVYTLRGGIVLGFFPALASVFQVIYLALTHKGGKFKSTFQESYKENFRISNQLGFTALTVCLFLWVDLRISGNYIQVPILHYLLILLFILALGTSLFLFPVVCRYSLTYVEYLRQAAILFFTNLIEAIAILVGVFLVVWLYVIFPILLIIAGVPLLLFPIIWFALQAMIKTERKVEMS